MSGRGKRLRPERKHRLNISGGINQGYAPIGDPEPFVVVADGLTAARPPALSVLFPDTSVAAVANVLDLRRCYKTDGTARIFKRLTGSGNSLLDSVALTGIPTQGSGRYSSCLFRGKLIVATEGAAAYSVDVDTASPTPYNLSDATTNKTYCPMGGIVQSWKNYLWMTGNKNDLLPPIHTIPLMTVGVPYVAKGVTGAPSSVDFGTVKTLTETPERLCYVRNDGSVAVKITGIAVKGNDYKVTTMPNLPYTLPPAGTFSFGISFCPETKGVREGTILISTDMAVETEGGAWTVSGAVVTPTTTPSWTASQYSSGFYAHLESTGHSYDIPITANSTSAFTVDQASGIVDTGASLYEIRHQPTVKITLTGIGTSRIMNPSPPYADFGQWLSYAGTGAGAVEQTVLMTWANPYSDPIYIDKTGNWVITSPTGATYTLTDYKVNDGDFHGHSPASDDITINAGKSLIVKLRVQVTTGTGALAGKLTVQTREAAKPTRVYFSAVIDETDWTPSTDWLDFQDKKGEAGDMLALIPYGDMLWAVTESNGFVITGSSGLSFSRQEIPLMAGVGIVNQFSWAISHGSLFLISKKGVYRATGTEVVDISENIKDYVAGWSSYSTMRMGAYRNYIVVFDGTRFLLYDVLKGIWTIDSSVTSCLATCSEEGGSDLGTMLYSTTAAVYRYDDHSYSNPTHAVKIVFPWDSFGSPSIIKRLHRVAVLSEIPDKITGVAVLTDRNLSATGVSLTAIKSTAATDIPANGYIEFMIPPDYNIGASFAITVTASAATSGKLIYGVICHYTYFSDVGSVQ